MKKLISSLVDGMNDSELFEALACIRREIDRRHGIKVVLDKSIAKDKPYVHHVDFGHDIFNL